MDDFNTKFDSEANGDEKLDKLPQSENNSSSEDTKSSIASVPLSGPSTTPSVNLAVTTSATNSKVPVVSNSAASSTPSSSSTSMSTEFVFDERIMNSAAGKEFKRFKDGQILDSILKKIVFEEMQTEFADYQTEESDPASFIKKEEEQRKQPDPLIITVKLLNILEGIELFCKPDEINTKDWKELATSVRWEQLLSHPSNHAWVEDFMKCANKSTLEEMNYLIEDLFDISNEIQDDYFAGKPANFDKLLCKDLKEPLNFLNRIGLQITYGSRSLTEMLEIVVNTTDSQDDKDNAEKIKNENFDSATTTQESDNQQAEHSSREALEFPTHGVSSEDSFQKESEEIQEKY
ncbi:uncharacterized protein LOC135839802 isoform X2 [Planococcus citri]|uniref:uncharacterized protein LOC135839802 isoform X2 n=1 Tax=Planococcus citri TaxID=170843 RepID=UPI0031F81AC8